MSTRTRLPSRGGTVVSKVMVLPCTVPWQEVVMALLYRLGPAPRVGASDVAEPDRDRQSLARLGLTETSRELLPIRDLSHAIRDVPPLSSLPRGNPGLRRRARGRRGPSASREPPPIRDLLTVIRGCLRFPDLPLRPVRDFSRLFCGSDPAVGRELPAVRDLLREVDGCLRRFATCCGKFATFCKEEVASWNQEVANRGEVATCSGS